MLNPFEEIRRLRSDLKSLTTEVTNLKAALSRQGLSVRSGCIEDHFVAAYGRVVRAVDLAGRLTDAEDRMVKRMDEIAKAASLAYIPASTTPGAWVKLED